MKNTMNGTGYCFLAYILSYELGNRALATDGILYSTIFKKRYNYQTITFARGRLRPLKLGLFMEKLISTAQCIFTKMS